MVLSGAAGNSIAVVKGHLKRVISETGGMLIAFFFGAIGTTVGALLGYFLLPLGEHAPKLAGVFSATYIGGSMNMAAVSQSVSLDPAVAVASVAADNVVGVVYLAFLALVPSMVFSDGGLRFLKFLAEKILLRKLRRIIPPN